MEKATPTKTALVVHGLDGLEEAKQVMREQGLSDDQVEIVQIGGPWTHYVPEGKYGDRPESFRDFVRDNIEPCLVIVIGNDRPGRLSNESLAPLFEERGIQFEARGDASPTARSIEGEVSIEQKREDEEQRRHLALQPAAV